MEERPLFEKQPRREIILTQPEMPLVSISNETLLEKPNAKLNPEIEIKEYFKKMDAGYLDQLKALGAQIGHPMEKNNMVEICIPVAKYQEINTISSALQAYGDQNIDPTSFEVLLFVNSPVSNKSSEGGAISIIERTQAKFPHLRIRKVEAKIPDEQVRISNLRKIVTDLALVRQKQAEINRDLILISNDADNQGISENYVQSYIQYFQKNGRKEAAVGNLCFDPHAFVRFPVVHIQQELSTLLDQAGFRNGNITLYGNNSCMKSSIYSSIGGYPPGLKIEQEWTGDTIKKLRGDNSTLGFVEDGSLSTSSRRGVASIILGLKEQLAFSDESNEEIMRSLSLNSFPVFDWGDKEAVGEMRIKMEKAIDNILDIYEKGEGYLGKDAFFYHSNLEKMGIIYHLNKEGHTKIINMDKFIERQELMQKMLKIGEQNMTKVIEESWKV